MSFTGRYHAMVSRGGVPRAGSGGVSWHTGQQGAVLVVALVFLLLLTILAISASQSSLLQERMAGGLRNAQLAEWSAENTLRGAEWKLFTGDTSVTCYNSSTASAVSSTVTNFRDSSTWITTGATEYEGEGVSMDYTDPSTSSTALQTAKLAENPWYMIEYLGQDLAPGSTTSRATEAGSSSSSTAKFYIYRITARATGGSANTIRVVQSTFVTPNLFTCTLS